MMRWILMLFLLFPSLAQADAILNFESKIEIHPRRVLLIQETIHYDFGEIKGHGILRNIPEDHEGQIEILSVTDEQNRPYVFEDEGLLDPNEVRLKIGDPTTEIDHEHVFIITYSISGEIQAFEEHDEIHWNVNGSDWGVPIEKTSAQVWLPKKIELESIQTQCFTGFYREQEQHCTSKISPSNGKVLAQFETTKTLEANDYGSNEDMTLVVGFPLGILKAPIEWSTRWLGEKHKTEIQQFIQESILILMSLALFFGSILTWYKKGRDPKIKSPLIAMYESPNGLSAAEIDVLSTNKISQKSITATLFELGMKGVLKIIDKNENSGENKKPDLAFLLQKPLNQEEATLFQKYIYKKIFDNGELKERRLTDMQYKLSNHHDLLKPLIEKLKTEGYYETEPHSKISKLFWMLGIVGIFASLTLGGKDIQNGWLLFGVSHVPLILSFFMTKKTQKGVETLHAIKGFKWFLKVAEKDRLQFHHPPNQTLELFQKLLPHAVVFGLEKKWTESFEKIFELENQNNRTLPWMPISGKNLNAIMLTHYFGALEKGSRQSSGFASGSKSSTSGFSGGFSGSGSGGGGGGRW